MAGEESQHILQIVGLIVLPFRQFSFIQLVSQGKCLCIPLICHDIFLGHSMCLLKILGLIIFLQNIQSPVFPIQIDHAWSGCLGLHLQIRQLLLPVGITEFGRKRAISAIAQDQLAKTGNHLSPVIHILIAKKRIGEILLAILLSATQPQPLLQI